MTKTPKGLIKVEGLLTSKGKVYIPNEVRELLMKEYHDSSLAGHLRANKILAVI